MANDPTEPIREEERERWRERELKDLEVERKRGPRPLEGFSGEDSGTTWTDQQDDEAAREVHAHDREESIRASEEQVPPPLPDEGAGERH